MFKTNYKKKSNLLLSVFTGIAIIVMTSLQSFGQFAVTTNSGSGLNPTYPSLAAAITALNLAVISSPVIITCPTGTEAVPAAGYVITAQGSSLNSIIIQGNGAANSLITPGGAAGVGLGTTTTLDAFFKLNGADFVTIQGFGITDASASASTIRSS